jgi:hypothetical protein
MKVRESDHAALLQSQDYEKVRPTRLLVFNMRCTCVFCDGVFGCGNTRRFKSRR